MRTLPARWLKAQPAGSAREDWCQRRNRSPHGREPAGTRIPEKRAQTCKSAIALGEEETMLGLRRPTSRFNPSKSDLSRFCGNSGCDGVVFPYAVCQVPPLFAASLRACYHAQCVHHGPHQCTRMHSGRCTCLRTLALHAHASSLHFVDGQELLSAMWNSSPLSHPSSCLQGLTSYFKGCSGVFVFGFAGCLVVGVVVCCFFCLPRNLACNSLLTRLR